MRARTVSAPRRQSAHRHAPAPAYIPRRQSDTSRGGPAGSISRELDDDVEAFRRALAGDGAFKMQLQRLVAAFDGVGCGDEIGLSVDVADGGSHVDCLAAQFGAGPQRPAGQLANAARRTKNARRSFLTIAKHDGDA